MKINIENRDQWIYRTTLIGFIVGVLMSFHLWFSERPFPLVPVFDGFTFPIWLSTTLIAFFFLLSITLLFREKRYLVVFLIVVVLLFGIEDQMRWQPWVYHYLLFLFPFCFKSKEIKILYFQIILIGIYFWSGVFKLNPNFIYVALPNFEIISERIGLFMIPQKIGYLVPVIEISIAIALVFRKTRKIALLLSVFTHVLIILYLSPLVIDFNSIVIPWNVTMIIFVTLCFLNEKKSFFDFKILSKQNRIQLVTAFLIFVTPILNYFEKWDYYFSFNLYSGRTNELYIDFENDKFLDSKKYNFENTYLLSDHFGNKKIIDLNRWSMKELNVPVPPEKRIFKKIIEKICESQKSKFILTQRPFDKNEPKIIDCNSLDF